MDASDNGGYGDTYSAVDVVSTSNMNVLWWSDNALIAVFGLLTSSDLW